MSVDQVTPEAALALELLAGTAYAEQEAVTEVIRPSAVLPETAALRIVSELAARDARSGGEWIAEPTAWRRYDRAWSVPDVGAQGTTLLGTIQVAYGTPARYDITVFRVTITQAGAAAGWTVESLCDEAFGFAGLSLRSCPRTALVPPPRPFRLR